jgi:LysR family glycine cleavage system transcriptional activator
MNLLQKLPPFKALTAFEAVARHSSVAKAADELCVTPAAVSQQIKSLETYFGRPLFLRLPRGLVPTEEARAFLIDLADSLNGLVGASEMLRQENHSGTVRLSVLPSLATRWLAPRIGRFKRRFPQIELVINSELQLTDFAGSDYDLALRYGSGIYPGLKVESLMGEILLPVCSPRLLSEGGGLRRPADLAAHCLLHETLVPVRPSLDDWIMWDPWLRSWSMSSSDCPNRIHMSDSAAILSAVEEGCGVAIGRSRLMANQLQSGRLVPLFGEQRQSNLGYYLVSRPHSAEFPRVAAVRAWLRDEADMVEPTHAVSR